MYNLRLAQLSVLQTIFETGSMTEAARRLNLTLSAASRALVKCQQAFGDELFVRNFRGMVPTEKCRELMPHVTRILGEVQEMASEKSFDPARISRTLCIAAADNAVVSLLRPALRAIIEAAPQMNFRLMPLTEDVLRELAEGSVDLALLPTVRLKRLPEHYFGLNFFKVRRACLVCRNHPLAKRHAQGARLTKRDFLKYPKIAVELRQRASEPVFDVDTPITRGQRKLIEMPHFLSAPYFLKGTLATLVLPVRTAEFFARMLPEELAVIPIPGEGEDYWTRLIWHERTHASREMQWIRSMFVSLLRPSGDDGGSAAPRHENVQGVH